MKNIYVTPEIEMIALDMADILTSSLGIYTPLIPTEDDEWVI